MIFLIQYNRTEGRIISFRKFGDSEYSRARAVRLDLELDLNRKGIDHEVVLLESSSEEVLRKTHGRYFESIAEIAKSLADYRK